MYDPKNSEEKPTLPPDTIFDGVVINLEDDKVKTFVKNTAKWTGDLEGYAINLKIEVKHNEKAFTFEEMFPYTNEGEKTIYSPRSKLGKFAKKYGKLPDVESQVKCEVNSEGFLKLKLN